MGLEVLHGADPIDEYAVQQLRVRRGVDHKFIGDACRDGREEGSLQEVLQAVRQRVRPAGEVFERPAGAVHLERRLHDPPDGVYYRAERRLHDPPDGVRCGDLWCLVLLPSGRR